MSVVPSGAVLAATITPTASPKLTGCSVGPVVSGLPAKSNACGTASWMFPASLPTGALSSLRRRRPLAVRVPAPDAYVAFVAPSAARPNALGFEHPGGVVPLPSIPDEPPAPSTDPGRPPSPSSVSSKHAPPTIAVTACARHTCPPAHWLVISHGVRHCSSEAHRSVVGHGFVPLHVSSCGSSQTPVVPDTMQRSAGLVTGQSLETSHALWHLPNAQMSGESQSLLIEQLPESSTPDELQLADVAAITAATRRSAARATARRTFGVDTIELAKRDAPTRQRRGLAFDADT